MPLDLAPSNADAEQFVIGTILLDESFWPDVIAVLKPGDFSIETHQRIFRRMGDLHERGEHIDRITVYVELEKQGEGEACGGMSYLARLTDGLPEIPRLDAYLRIVHDLSIRRRGILMHQHAMNRLADDSRKSLRRNSRGLTV